MLWCLCKYLCIFVPKTNSTLSNLLVKSELNLEAAQLLIDTKYHASSVHCSYYACLQFIKIKWSESSGMSFEDIDNHCFSLKENSHKYLIDNIVNEYSSKQGVVNGGLLRRKVQELKGYRIESDYNDVLILSNVSKHSLDLSKVIINELDIAI